MGSEGFPKVWRKYLPDGPVLYPNFFPSEHLLHGPSYTPSGDDVLVCSYPKCGTIWVQDITYQLVNHGEVVQNVMDFDLTQPWLDSQDRSTIEASTPPRVIKTHLSPGAAPLCMPFNPDSHYIIVVRNPLDVAVSYYHHLKSWSPYGYQDVEFDAFFNLFMTGDVVFGWYAEYLKRWAPFMDRLNVLVLRYEDLKKDSVLEVNKIASFLVERGVVPQWFSDKDIVQIASNSTFESMKARTPKRTRKEQLSGDIKEKATDEFVHMRKGVIGDYKQFVTEDQKRQLVQAYRKELAGTVAAHWWSDVFQQTTP